MQKKKKPQEETAVGWNCFKSTSSYENTNYFITLHRKNKSFAMRLKYAKKNFILQQVKKIDLENE